MDSSERSRRLADSPLGGMPGDGLGPARRQRARRLAADERRFLPPTEHRPASPKERWRLLVRGRVQGVGYRAGCSRRALELGVGGWVRNRADGCVEVEAEGSPIQLAELRLWCERGPLMAQVSAVESTQIPGRGDDWFEIRA
ncbi:MAG: acylphosphatase [Cyanobium sp.]